MTDTIIDISGWSTKDRLFIKAEKGKIVVCNVDETPVNRLDADRDK